MDQAIDIPQQIEPVEMAFLRLLLTSNQFKVGKVRKDGTVRAHRRVLNLERSLQIDFEVFLCPHDKARLKMTRLDNHQHVAKLGTNRSVVESAIANAHAAL